MVLVAVAVTELALTVPATVTVLLVVEPRTASPATAMLDTQEYCAETHQPLRVSCQSSIQRRCPRYFDTGWRRTRCQTEYFRHHSEPSRKTKKAAKSVNFRLQTDQTCICKATGPGLAVATAAKPAKTTKNQNALIMMKLQFAIVSCMARSRISSPQQNSTDTTAARTKKEQTEPQRFRSI